MFKDFHQTAQPAIVRPVPVAPRPVPAPRPATVTPSAAQDTDRHDLKQHLHEAILSQMSPGVIDQLDRAELKHEIGALVAPILNQRGVALGADRFRQLLAELMDEVLGLGPLENLLAEPTVTDILVNGPDRIFVERRGLLERSPLRFRDEKHLLRIIDKIISRVGRRIDESQPWDDARIEDGSRDNAIIRPRAIDGPSLSIRKFNADKLTLDKLVSFGALCDTAALFLSACVQSRMNVLISGGTGSGKTTMLNAMSGCIDHRQRIVTIEDAAGLQLQQEQVVRLETRPATAEGCGQISQRELVNTALPMRPDRIVIGEVHGAEAFDMLQAMNTGHDGSVTTIHANTARDALSRLEQMVVMIGADFPMSAVRSQIAAGIGIVVQRNRLADGSRRVMSISEVTGQENGIVLMQEIFIIRKSGLDADGRVIGRFAATGIRPKCLALREAAGHGLPIGTFTAPEGAS